MKYFAEFFGTIILVVLGNGSVANSVLRDTGGNSRDGQANGGWLLIAFGFGFGVMLPAMLFGSISGNHLNPAVTLAQACSGVFPFIDDTRIKNGIHLLVNQGLNMTVNHLGRVADGVARNGFNPLLI